MNRRQFIGSLAGDQAIRIVAILQKDLPGFVTESDAGTWVENGFVERVFAKFGSDFGKIGSEVDALAVDLVAFDAADVVAAEDGGSVCGIAGHFD